MQTKLRGVGWALGMAFTAACGDPAPPESPLPSDPGAAGAGNIVVPRDAGAQPEVDAGTTPPPVEPPVPVVGSACVPAAEFRAAFSGFAASEVTVEAASAYCVAGDVCLIDHFEGRVSCPYGQDSPAGAGGCVVPGSDQRVSAAVAPQRLDRRAADAVYCSCRCAGPDPGADYCQCGDGFSCVERIPALASGENAELAGSYCVRDAAAVPNPVALNAASCELGAGQCGAELGLPASLPARAPAAPPAAATSSPFLQVPEDPRKLDLLFMVDNSIGMADHQAVLAASVGELLERLANPVCVDAAGLEFPPPAAGAACPAGQQRQFEAFTDLHVGFVTSSMGDIGASAACPEEGFPQFVPDRVDNARLLGSLPRGAGAGANAQGFLEWRAGQAGFAAFSAGAQSLVRAAGDRGCGWEQSLESWYRFLVDPAPSRGLERVVCPGSSSTATNCVRPAVDAQNRVLVDDVLLAQRQAFLRPDSTLAVVMLSDENDCSLQVGNQTWVVVNIQDMRPMFRGSSVCAEDPNDRCCYICPLTPPEGCEVDPACSADALNVNRLSPEQDGQNLRCFDQKRRFGLDFLLPTRRYVNALTQPTLCTSALDLSTDGCAPADLVPNGLFTGGRQASEVVLAGLVGVPWQAIASSTGASGSPLSDGQLRFKSAAQRSAPADDTWAQILGSPGVPFRAATESLPEVASQPRVLPTLPQMVESELPRAGVVTGNPLNGRDYSTLSVSSNGNSRPDDLEYACLWPLPAERDCSALDPNTQNCDCYEGAFDRPVCEQTPGASSPGTTQYWGGAKPGSRQLQVLKDLGESGVVASACPRNTSAGERPDFGYRPALRALLERLESVAP